MAEKTMEKIVALAKSRGSCIQGQRSMEGLPIHGIMGIWEWN